MTESVAHVAASDYSLQPIDIVNGLGSADRSLLATSLALFDDSTLSKRIGELAHKVADRVRPDGHIKEAARSVETRMAFWRDSELSDDDLRLTLWIYLREAFGLPPRLTRSTRGAEALAVELTAATIHLADPPGAGRAIKDQLAKWGWREGGRCYTTLSDVVQPVVQELIKSALAEGAGQMDPAAQEKLIADTRARLRTLSEPEQQRMLDAVGARELNDAAVRNILLTGGGLGALSAAVGMAGFSAYILAAQASAFIPLISGPALVSTVAVLSNPVTVIAATAAAMWWFTTSTNSQVRTAVALRVVALLALQGLSGSRAGLDRALASFARMEGLPRTEALASAVYESYASDWALLTARSSVRAGGVAVDPRIADWMRRPVSSSQTGDSRWRRLIFPETGEERMTATVGALTLGDVAYAAAAVDPTVLQAADFARADAIDDPLAFAELARNIEAMDPGGAAGAVANLKGYVAERVVAAELVANGHQVAFPPDPNHPGWDLLVDGKKFQIKCLADDWGLTEHFGSYPDIPVLVNSELAEHVPAEWAHQVFFLEGYSNELVTEVTDHSLEAGAEILEPDVPVFALGAIAVRQFVAYRSGEVSGVQAVEQTILDGTTRAALAAAGGFAGTGIGLLVFGPAGALVLGTVVPLLSQAQAGRVRRTLGGLIKSEGYREWEAKANRQTAVLCAVLQESLDEKLGILRIKYGAIGKDGVGGYVRARLLDDALYLDECRIRLDRLGREEAQPVEQRSLALIQWTAGSTVHPAWYQSELQDLTTMIRERPTLPQRTEEVVDRVAENTREAADRVGKRLKDIRQRLRSKS